MTDEQYGAVDEKVTSGGPPEGLKLHTCFREGDKLAIFGVWDSQETFDAFGAKLIPIVKEMGIEMSPPQVVEMVAFEIP
jgi:hypothetical protein